MVDVHALGTLLRQLNFKVVSLLDLRKAEMQTAVSEFLLLLDKGVYGAAAPAGAAPAAGDGQPGGFALAEPCGRPGEKRTPAGGGTSPALCRCRQVCSTTRGTATRTSATASWCPSTRPAPTRRLTASACSTCCSACSSAAPASTSSCSTCAARGDPAPAASLGTSCHAGRAQQGVPVGAGSPGGTVGCPRRPIQAAWLFLDAPKCRCPGWAGSAMPGGQRGRGQPPGVWGALGWVRGAVAGPSSAQRRFSHRNLNDDVIPQVGALQVTANIVFGYATWVPSPSPPAQAGGLPGPERAQGSAPRVGSVLFAPASFPLPAYRQRRSLWSMLKRAGERQPPVPHGAGRCPRCCSAPRSPRGFKLIPPGIWAEDALSIRRWAAAPAPPQRGACVGRWGRWSCGCWALACPGLSPRGGWFPGSDGAERCPVSLQVRGCRSLRAEPGRALQRHLRHLPQALAAGGREDHGAAGQGG